MTETIQPASAGEVAAALKRASDARRSIVIRGAGTKDGWGRPATRVDTVLDMRGLSHILAHEHGDMTATIEAGASLREVNAALAVHGQMLPLDPPFADRATIGGLLATNDSGPLRHRYGTPRDLVIGVQLATTDGVLSKAGGRVVKNVAGYDLGRLVTGSFGSLAAIVSATFKLSPIPAASKTLRIGLADPAAVADLVALIMASQLEPVAFEVETRTPGPQGGPSSAGFACLIRFASLPAVVDAQVAQATAAVKPYGGSLDVVEGDAEQALWDAHANGIWSGPGAIVRASWLPANIADVLARLPRQGLPMSSGSERGQHFSPAFTGRAAIGAGLIRVDGDVDAQARAIEQLRGSPLFGNIVIVRGSDELKTVIDVWGSHGSRQPLLDALKRTFDPNGVLNAGRGPL